MHDDDAIRCAGVVKRFGAVVALDHLDFTVARGTVVGYLGPNGAGKSTTIRILVDLARPDAGEARVLGLDPRRAGPMLRQQIGYLPGELRLDERLRVGETLRSWAKLRGREVDDAYVATLCERLDLDPTRATRGLSTGNRRKVGLVGAFMSRPEILILDEPTAGVDPLVRAEFLELVDGARSEGRTVFLSSHVLSEVQRVADRVLVIRSGKLVASGDLDEIRRSARQPFSAWFAGAPPLAELQALTGVGELSALGSEVSGVINGGLDSFLGVLSRHSVQHLVLPEPDLEQAFLHYYEDEAR